MTTDTKPQKRARGRRQADEATKMAKALAHPLRAAVLVELNKRTASPVDLARELDVPLPNVSYHVRTLVDLDCIELVGTKQRRGALEHFYRAIRRVEATDEAWSEMSPAARRRVSSQWYRAVFSDASQALETGQLAKPAVHLSLTHVELDDAGWQEITAQMIAVVERALELQAATLAKEGAGAPRAGRLVMGLYEPAPARKARGKRS